jgi:GNAT superfamily N-acetyltransferase
MGQMPEGRAVSVRAALDDEDLDALNVGNPSWMGAAMMRRLFAASAESPTGALVAEIDGRPVGYGDFAAIAVLDGHRAPATVYVHPSARGQGAGKALWATVLQMCSPERGRGVMLTSGADDGQAQGIALAHGFQLGGLHIESELDLVGMERSPMEERAAAPAGLTLASLAPDADESTWLEFAAVHERVHSDTPDRAAGAEPMPYAVIRAFLAQPVASDGGLGRY